MVSGTRIFNGEFQVLDDSGTPIVRVTNNGIIISNNVIRNGDFLDLLHSDFLTTSTDYVSSGLGGFILGKYLDFNYQSGIMISAITEILNDTNGCGFEIALYRSTSGIPSSNSPIPQNDVKLTELPVVVFTPNIFLPVPLQFQDTVLNPTPNKQYYYIGVRAVMGGKIKVASSSNIKIQ